MKTISIMCPSRQRSKALEENIKILLSLAKNPEFIDIVVRIDDDDPEINEYKNIPGIKLIIGPAFGYRGLHIYYNDCAKASVADSWLFMWNDDVLMETKNWDTLIHKYDNQFICLAPQSFPHKKEFTIVPIIPKKWIDIIGYLSLNAQSDAWLEDIARKLNIFKWININVLHNRADITGENNDETFHSRNYQTNEFYSSGCKVQRELDAEMLSKYLNTASN